MTGPRVINRDEIEKVFQETSRGEFAANWRSEWQRGMMRLHRMRRTGSLSMKWSAWARVAGDVQRGIAFARGTPTFCSEGTRGAAFETFYAFTGGGTLTVENTLIMPSRGCVAPNYCLMTPQTSSQMRFLSSTARSWCC